MENIKFDQNAWFEKFKNQFNQPMDAEESVVCDRLLKISRIAFNVADRGPFGPMFKRPYDAKLPNGETIKDGLVSIQCLNIYITILNNILPKGLCEMQIREQKEPWQDGGQ